MRGFKEDYSKKIEQFKKKGNNMKCFECNQKGTTYICMPFGTFVCSDCSGVLSHLNYKVKGLGVATFNKTEYEFILKNGNDVARKKWMAKFDENKDKYPKHKDYDDIRKCIINKYQFKKYCNDKEIENKDKENNNNEKEKINENRNNNNINTKEKNDFNIFNFDNAFNNNNNNKNITSNNNNNSNSNINQNTFDFNNFDFNNNQKQNNQIDTNTIFNFSI